MGYNFAWYAVTPYLPAILKGVVLTLYIAFLAMGVGLVVGLVVALMRMSSIKPLQWLGLVYLELFRGIPQYVFILWVYFGFSMATGINMSPITAGVLCLGVQYAGYLAEIYRAGIESVNRGQWEASYSLGLTSVQAFRYTIFPQALRVIIPPAANMFIGMMKDTSLVGIIGVFELIRTTQDAVNMTYRPFEFFTIAGAIYIMLTVIFSRLIRVWERRLGASDTKSMPMTKALIPAQMGPPVRPPDHKV